MLTRIKRLPSPALVISAIALIVAVGGGTFAIAAITNPKVKRISKRQANKQIRKKAPGLSVLHAQSADTATNADHATTADKATTTDAVTSFAYGAAGGSTNKTVLDDFHGLTLTASCTAGVNNGLTVKATSATAGAYIAYESSSQGGTGGTATGTVHNDSVSLGTAPFTIMSPTSFVSTTNGTVGVGFATGQIVYAKPGAGNRVSVTWQYASNAAGHPCLWTGTATGTDDGPPDVASGPASKVRASSVTSERRLRHAH